MIFLKKIRIKSIYKMGLAPISLKSRPNPFKIEWNQNIDPTQEYPLTRV